MTDMQQLWVERNNLRSSKIMNQPIQTIEHGQVLVAIDKFGLTANNVSYGVSGDAIGYWNYFPVNPQADITAAEGQWGIVPVWACGSVIESQSDDIRVGERLWGFFPMSSHVVLTPGKIREDQFTDVVEHRSKLPSLYNHYRRTAAEPEVLTQMENERCLLFPLFATSFTLSDFLIHHDFFAAEQVVIGSASSKTAFGLAQLLSSDGTVSKKVIGITSAGNEAFVRSLGIYDDVILYGEENKQDASIKTAYVDMSGDINLTVRLHEHFQDNLVVSSMVGATHWEDRGAAKSLPGAKPTFFFAPGHMGQRDAELGKGTMMMRAMMAGVQIATAMKGTIDVQWIKDAQTLQSTWADMLENKVNPNTGLMVSLLK